MISNRFSDTHPQAERVQIEGLRAMSVSRKLQIVSDLILASREMGLAGLRGRFPHASPEEVRRRLATLWLGPELAKKVYGPEPDPPTMI